MSDKQKKESHPTTKWEKLNWQGVTQYFQYHIPRLLGKSQLVLPNSPAIEQIPLPQITVGRCYNINGIKLEIYDYASSGAANLIAQELSKEYYGLDSIPFEENDVVIDIGGHIGILSIYLAKLRPNITIYAYEPIPDNFHHFQKNIAANGVTNIHLFNQAVTNDGRSMLMTVNFKHNSGGATATWEPGNLDSNNYVEYPVESTTLNSIFETYKIDHCRLLKIDCEGSEYEILLNTSKLTVIDYLSAEFHTNEHLSAKGFNPQMLYDYCCQYIPAENISYMTWDIPG